jgi:hypothetical protein
MNSLHYLCNISTKADLYYEFLNYIAERRFVEDEPLGHTVDNRIGHIF